jgi:hypothetical protein
MGSNPNEDATNAAPQAADSPAPTDPPAVEIAPTNGAAPATRDFAIERLPPAERPTPATPASLRPSGWLSALSPEAPPAAPDPPPWMENPPPRPTPTMPVALAESPPTPPALISPRPAVAPPPTPAPAAPRYQPPAAAAPAPAYMPAIQAAPALSSAPALSAAPAAPLATAAATPATPTGALMLLTGEEVIMQMGALYLTNRRAILYAPTILRAAFLRDIDAVGAVTERSSGWMLLIGLLAAGIAAIAAYIGLTQPNSEIHLGELYSANPLLMAVPLALVAALTLASYFFWVKRSLFLSVGGRPLIVVSLSGWSGKKLEAVDGFVNAFSQAKDQAGDAP